MTAADSQAENKVVEPGGLRFGPLTMMPGVSAKNLFGLFFASFFGIATMSFINASQPYVMTEMLLIPLDEQGTLAGNLTVVQEIVLLSLLGPIGALSDKIGRKPLYVTAFVLLGLAYFLYPLAGTILSLFLFRMIFAAGAANNVVMLPAVANDYPQEGCRAKMLATCFIFNGLGIVIVLAIFRGLPVRFADMGFDPIWVGRYWLWVMAALCLFVAVVIALTLKPGAPKQLKKREPLLATFKIGIRAARNGRIALAYAAASVSRGDLSVMSTFFTLWLTQEGIRQGLPTAEAAKTALTFYVFVQGASLPWAPIAGYMLDRIDRLYGLAIAMVIAGVGYSSLWLLDNPLGMGMYLCAALIGMGEMTANLAATSLIGKEAPERGRGAVLGMWSFCGALGILTVALVGGYLFDNVSQIGPFMFVAGANILLFFWSVFLILRRFSENASAKSGSA
ncbi:MAG: MFS transporter [Gammaproteobacteria bacterium]|nr:MFS transporter [Chromatiales bacterium]MDP6674632.1 MFS transporter [Gammaproteobacteria bacterium]